MERHAGNPQAAVNELIAAANRAGGKDNVTVLVVEGEQFTQPAVLPPQTQPTPWISRALLFVAGFVAAVALGWLTRSMWQPAPVVIAPRVIAVTTTIAAAMAGRARRRHRGSPRRRVSRAGAPQGRRHPARPRPSRAQTPRRTMSNGPAVIAEGVKGARLSGFRILADPQMPLSVGILLRDSAVEIDDVEVKGAGVGIEIRGSASPTLRANAIRDCLAEGVLILGPAAPWLSHNLIQANKGAGVAARDGAKASLLANTFDRNVLDPPATDAIKELNFFLTPPRQPRPTHPRPEAKQ